MSEADEVAAPAAEVEEDDSPDYVRMGILACILCLLVGFFVYTRFINPPKKTYYTDLPGLNLAAISAPQLEEILKQANAMACDCGYPGCTWNVAECRHMDPACDVSLKHAAEIVQSVTGKKAVVTVPMPTPRTPTASPKKTGATGPSPELAMRDCGHCSCGRK